MTTPTLGMQIFGQQQREAGLKRVRHEAAKKAWRTRRRLAKPSAAMRTVLKWLAKYKEARLSLCYHGPSWMYSVSLVCINDDAFAQRGGW